MKSPYPLAALLLASTCVWAANISLHIPEAEGKKAAIHKPAPEYPMMARQLKVTGKVNMEVVVAEDGSVSDVRTVSGNPILAKAAVEALKKWKFRPFEQEGRPAAAVVALGFEFDTH